MRKLKNIKNNNKTQKHKKHKKHNKRNPKTRKSNHLFTKKYNKMNHGGTILGQGTHGVIRVDNKNKNYVIKEYSIGSINNCDKLVNEYSIQKYFNESLQNIGSEIIVPECCCYQQNNEKCWYKMKRIYNFPNKEHYIVVNMSYPFHNTKFCHSKSACEIGYEILEKEYDIDVSQLSYQIGRLFSYIHFVLEYDGYDCELLIGSDNEQSINHQFYLIDFDKVQKVNYIMGEEVYRKLDENTIVMKKLDTLHRYAWFLFAAMISMSLIPVDRIHKNRFIAGYGEYIDKTHSLKADIHKIVVDNIIEYSV